MRIGDVQPRFEIVNAAAATYVTQSLRIPLTADSNLVTNVVAAPDMTLTKRHSPEFVAGAVSTIRIVVSNVGNLPSDGSTITVTDPLPDAFASFANAGGDGWACSIPARTLVCTRSGALADGASFPPIFIDVTLPDPAPASIINTVSVAGGGDVNPDNNTASDVGGTAQAADLRITKTAIPSTVLSGATVRFLLTVSNDGPSTAQAVIVSDPLGADYRDATATPSVGTCTAAVQCSLGDLARGRVRVDHDRRHGRGQRHDPDQYRHGRLADPRSGARQQHRVRGRRGAADGRRAIDQDAVDHDAHPGPAERPDVHDRGHQRRAERRAPAWSSATGFPPTSRRR